ncbi:MAG TPA: hypothetical protein VL337_01395 [Acidimicrobiales bacterium]|nr:hypothetical protein [Acidimicrobiales bacterium]
MSQILDQPLQTAASASPRRDGRRRLTWGECLLSDLFALWVIVGLFVDGWAHNHQKPETAFTPWHGILYSGFLVSAWWALRVARRDRRTGESMWRSAPVGHSLVLVGVIVFAIGGTSDLVWHAVFGVEASLAALLSPTHLLMLAGALLVMTGPFRSGWADGRQQAPSFRQFLPTLLSLILATALVAFFFQYATPFRRDSYGTWVSPYTSLVTRFAGAGANYRESIEIVGMLSLLVTNLVYVGALLFPLRRWRLPFGTATVLFCSVTALVGGIDGFRRIVPLVAALPAGLVADLLIRRLDPSPRRRGAAYAVAAATSLTLWLGFFGAYQFAYGVGWTPELWAGALVMATMSATGLSLLAFPAPLPTPAAG